jgi:mRNA-degrading endonuclease RelE of RelBE toxin-antitoxin system
MVIVRFDKEFRKNLCKIDASMREKLLKQISKIQSDPEIGKPMRYGRKGTREVYLHPYRLSYFYSKSEDKISIMAIYHKDEQ